MARDITLPARFASLKPLLAWLDEQIQAQSSREDCTSVLSQRIQLVVEELLANTIHHGYGGESDHPVTLSLRCRDATVSLVYEDQAPSFNPLAEPLDNRQTDQLGGIGLPLIRRLPRAVRYQPRPGGNRIELDFAWPPPA